MNQALMLALACVSGNLSVSKTIRDGAFDEWHRLRRLGLTAAGNLSTPGSLLPRHA